MMNAFEVRRASPRAQLHSLPLLDYFLENILQRPCLHYHYHHLRFLHQCLHYSLPVTPTFKVSDSVCEGVVQSALQLP
jgi:hypothetical protein